MGIELQDPSIALPTTWPPPPLQRGERRSSSSFESGIRRKSFLYFCWSTYRIATYMYNIIQLCFRRRRSLLLLLLYEKKSYFQSQISN
jgi:hypothetical protein